jgi:precorrin-6A/cobalt-precorrin-6A reductase
MATFEKIKPDWLVVKHAGGGAGRSKLDAARKLGIRVAMIARPEAPAGVERREQICDALEWAENLSAAAE